MTRRRRHHDLQARYAQVIEQRDDALKTADSNLRQIVSLARQIDQLREQVKAKPAEADLISRLDLSDRARGALDAQCRTLQNANEAMCRELRDIAEGRPVAEVTPS